VVRAGNAHLRHKLPQSNVMGHHHGNDVAVEHKVKHALPPTQHAPQLRVGGARRERGRGVWVGWLASRRLVGRPGLGLPANGCGGADGLGRQARGPTCRPRSVPHLWGDEMDVDQVLDGSRPAHADAHLLPQPAAGTVGGDKVLPCRGQRAKQADVCSQGTHQRAGVHHGVFVACLCWATLSPLELTQQQSQASAPARR
jgi:hypothetical protein